MKNIYIYIDDIPEYSGMNYVNYFTTIKVFIFKLLSPN